MFGCVNENEPLLLVKSQILKERKMLLPKFVFGRCLGIILAILSSLALSLPPIFLKNLFNYDPFNPAFWGGIGIIVSSVCKMIYSVNISSAKTLQDLTQVVFPLNTIFKKISFFILLIRGPIFFGIVILMFLAIENGSVGDVTAIMNSSPVPVMILSYIFFKEPFKIVQVIAIILLLSGIFVISKPEFITADNEDSVNPNYLAGLGYAVAVLLLNALDNITLRYLRKIDVETIMFITGVLVTIFCLVSIPIFSNFKLPHSTKEWVSAFGLAISASIGFALLALALKYERSSVISFFQVLPVVLVYIWEVLLFNLVPDYLSILGAILIVSSTLLICAAEYTSSDNSLEIDQAYREPERSPKSIDL